MLDIIREAINRFYIKRNRNLFQTLCKAKIQLPKELKDYIKSQKLVLEEYPNLKDYPINDWDIRFDKYKKNSFEIFYKTSLEISKVVPLFHMQHEFDIEIRGKHTMTATLGEYSDQPYSKKQAKLDHAICTILNKSGYRRIYSRDLDTPIQGFNMLDGVTIFGPDVTPEHLFFKDIYYFAKKTKFHKKQSHVRCRS